MSMESRSTKSRRRKPPDVFPHLLTRAPVETDKRKPFRFPFLLRVMLSSRRIYLSTFPAVDGWFSAPLLPQQV